LIVGFAGHTQILALFDRRQIESTLAGEALIRIYQPPLAILAATVAHSSVVYIAFSIAPENFEFERRRHEGGLDVSLAYQ
jgi:hypothetical protein